MKKIISTTLLLTSFSLVGCEGIHNKFWDNRVVSPEPIASTTNSSFSVPETNIIQKTRDGEPKVATIRSMIQGDLKCYVSILDQGGIKQELGATFDICAQGEKFLSKKVNLTYETVKVNDCESNEPCGKTKEESLITKMDISPNAATQRNKIPDVVTFTNGQWTIAIGGQNSWDGMNNTGNLTYYGCNSGGRCIRLRGGKVNCREGECTIVWKNSDRDYVVKGRMNFKNGHHSVSPSTLIVRQNNKVIATAQGLRPLN